MVFDIQPFFQLLLAALLGALVGLERKGRGKEAGMRTFALVALGCCLFTILDIKLLDKLSNVDGSVGVVQAVAIGIGFLGSGIIIQHKGQVEGLTTAAALWATAGIGVGIGMGFYSVTLFGAFLALLILASLDWFDKALFKENQDDKN